MNKSDAERAKMDDCSLQIEELKNKKQQRDT